MLNLLVLKDRLQVFYSKYDVFVTAFIKFTLSYVALFILNINLGYFEAFKNPMLIFIFALVCSVLPYGFISFFIFSYLLVNIYAVSMEMTLILAIFLISIVLLYYTFQPRDSYIMILLPILFVLKIPYAMPLLIGLGGSVFSIIPISCAIFIYYTLLYIKQNVAVLTSASSIDITERYSTIINALFENKTMLLLMVAFAVTVVVVHMIRSLQIDNAWSIAILIGVISLLFVIFLGNIMFGVSMPIIDLVIGLAVSILIAVVYHFFVFTVDYSATAYTQFEDEDYYYYVKAVPKLVLKAPDKKVQVFNMNNKVSNTDTIDIKNKQK